MLLPLLLMIAAGQQASDMLAPASEGMAQCYKPNVETKTCSALAYYDPTPDESYRNRAIVLIDPARSTTLETVTDVRIVDGAVCGEIKQDEIMAGKLSAGGTPLPDDRAKPALDQIAAALAPLAGKQICTRYTPDGDGLSADARLDGQPMGPSQHVIWVKPGDGYRVAP